MVVNVLKVDYRVLLKDRQVAPGQYVEYVPLRREHLAEGQQVLLERKYRLYSRLVETLKYLLLQVLDPVHDAVNHREVAVHQGIQQGVEKDAYTGTVQLLPGVNLLYVVKWL